MSATGQLRRTPLFAQHEALGAKLVGFAGWEMPVQYTRVREEHLAVRREAGVFDVSHMGQIETRGVGAEALLQTLLSNDVSRIAGAPTAGGGWSGGAQYSVLCREDGGVLDDLFTYRLGPERFLTVTNASNHARDLEWFRGHAGDFEVQVIDRLDDFAMLAVQGPAAREKLASRAEEELPGRLRTAELRIAGVDALVCGTGYTGEDGVEILLAPDHAPALWEILVELEIVPCGLAARDTLRLEACFHLYGNELTEQRGPIEAGLGWCCEEDTGFIGAEAVRRVREEGPDEVLVPLAFTGPGIPRRGNAVVGGGEVASGTLSPCLGIGVGMAYVPPGRAEPGTPLEIDVRGRVRGAEVRRRPLYRKDPVA